MMPGPPLVPGGLRIDLHAHTTFSDGDLTPEELVQRAVARRIAALSITDHDSVVRAAADADVELLALSDHDTVSGVREAFDAGASAGIRVVSAVEISTIDVRGADLHILGYYIEAASPGMATRLTRFREERGERMRRMVERLGQLGIRVELEDVLEIAGQGVIGRPHLAEALVRAGHAETADDAFRRLLGTHGLAYVPRPAFPDEHRLQFADVLSINRGKHTFKMGADVNRVHELLINLFQGGGVYTYAGSTAFNGWVADVMGVNLGDGLTGRHFATFVQVTDPVGGGNELLWQLTGGTETMKVTRFVHKDGHGPHGDNDGHDGDRDVLGYARDGDDARVQITGRWRWAPVF